MDVDKHRSDKIDNLVSLIKKLLEKLVAVESQLSDKCDVDIANRLDLGVKAVEDRTHWQVQDFVNKSTALEEKVSNQLNVYN